MNFNYPECKSEVLRGKHDFYYLQIVSLVVLLYLIIMSMQKFSALHVDDATQLPNVGSIIIYHKL